MFVEMHLFIELATGHTRFSFCLAAVFFFLLQTFRLGNTHAAYGHNYRFIANNEASYAANAQLVDGKCGSVTLEAKQGSQTYKHSPTSLMEVIIMMPALAADADFIRHTRKWLRSADNHRLRRALTCTCSAASAVDSKTLTCLFCIQAHICEHFGMVSINISYAPVVVCPWKSWLKLDSSQSSR